MIISYPYRKEKVNFFFLKEKQSEGNKRSKNVSLEIYKDSTVEKMNS